MNTRHNDPNAVTVVLPKDQLSVQRQRRREGRMTLSQLRRLLVADELRKRSKQGELF